MSKLSREVKLRRGERCETMSMREVHDLARLRDRGGDEILATLSADHAAFKSWLTSPQRGRSIRFSDYSASN